MTSDKYRQWANEVLEAERQGLASTQKHLSPSFSRIIELILESTGRVILCGMGKSGLVARKISATMSSTGTRSLFLHPAEAYHGDLGMVAKDDILILISNSGETEEVIRLLPFLKSNGNTIITITNNPQSTLASNCHEHLYLGITEEVCPLNLAPTTSTTATLALGDAMSIALMKAKNFKKENFAVFHPGGSLGKKLLTKVSDVMETDNLPELDINASFTDIISTISHSRFGCALIVKASTKSLLGIITDGDIRRAISQHHGKILEQNALALMTPSPLTITPDAKLIEAEKLMTQKKITCLPIVNHKKKLRGIIQIYDIS